MFCLVFFFFSLILQSLPAVDLNNSSYSLLVAFFPLAEVENARSIAHFLACDLVNKFINGGESGWGGFSGRNALLEV